MSLLNNNEMRAVARNTRAVFYDSLKASPSAPFLSTIFLIIQSNNLMEKFVMLRGTPKMRHWVGDRRIKSMSEASFYIEKKDWEATISVTRDDLDFDKLGLITPRIRNLAASFPRHYVDFVVDLLKNGFTRTGYDGQYFFDTDHDKGDGTSYSNKANVVFSKTAWEAAELAPIGLMDPESGEYLEIAWDTIYFGKNDQSTVDIVFNNPQYDAGGFALPNPHYGKIAKEKQHMLRQLGTSRKWFLTDESKAIKPLMLMIVKGVTFEAYDDPHDWNMFNRREAVYGIESQDNAGYAFWELAYGSLAGE